MHALDAADAAGSAMSADSDVPPGGRLVDDGVTFRRILGHFATGIVVVTAHDTEPIGMTCQSFSSVSLDPPLVMFCPARSSKTWPRIRAAGIFAINILAANQEEICRKFAVSGADKFVGVDWSPGLTGAPILSGVIAHIECRLETVTAGGDHDIVTGRPLHVGEGPRLAPLLFFRSQYGEFSG
jgi:3-hydroxy-9,10-secoandrosta-1,3,5(10)-triene-9,17-dione monooxygenase reductase component